MAYQFFKTRTIDTFFVRDARATADDVTIIDMAAGLWVCGIVTSDDNTLVSALGGDLRYGARRFFALIHRPLWTVGARRIRGMYTV